MVARYYKDGNVKDKYIGLLEVKNGGAESLFTAIKNFLSMRNIPLAKLFGVAADNASVMQEKISSVHARFREEIPDIFVIGCVCHSLALCSTAACKKLPTSVEILARDIVSYFSHSTKRQLGLKEFQEFVNAEQHKLLKLSQTRWLSLQVVVQRILEQWQALILFFSSEVYEKESTISPSHILSALRNPVFKLYFNF